MINLLTRIPVPYSAVSFYRSTGPFQHLRKIMPLQLNQPEHYNWMSIGMNDICFIERPHTANDLALIELCKSINIPVVIDYDDNLFEIPPWNPCYKTYTLNICAIMGRCIQLADEVTVSTERLGEYLNKFRAKECEIIPNAFPSHLIDFNEPTPPREKLVTWRGSNTHVRDLLLAVDGITEAHKKFPDWQFVFLGDPGWDVLEELPFVKTISPLDPVPYIKKLWKLAPAIHIVPLVDDEFNRCKSNIAYLEATYAGAKVIAPAWDEWVKSWVYRGAESFGETLLTLMEHESGKGVPDERDYVANNLLLDQVNLKRKELFESLV
jgi:glycosyltransferase involved in cell wall biosynthesis